MKERLLDWSAYAGSSDSSVHVTQQKGRYHMTAPEPVFINHVQYKPVITCDRVTSDATFDTHSCDRGALW